MTYLLCTQCAIPAVTPMATPMARQRKSVPPYGYLAVLGLAAIARNSHAHEADTDAASSVTISNDANIPNPAENQILTETVKANKLVGGDGNDEISGDAGHDRLFGHDGNDHLYGNYYNDRLSGGKDNDHLYGGRENDRLYGGNGIDHLYGQNGHDILHGNIGNDHLLGGAGDDVLYGGDGEDYLYGGTNTDGDAVLTDSTDTSVIYLTFDGGCTGRSGRGHPF